VSALPKPFILRAIFSMEEDYNEVVARGAKVDLSLDKRNVDAVVQLCPTCHGHAPSKDDEWISTHKIHTLDMLASHERGCRVCSLA
jgi:hypothetical protein